MVWEPHAEWLLAKLDGQPDIYLRELQAAAFAERSWQVSDMTRTCGRSPRGSRLRAKVPDARWETTTFLGAMRATGFVAPLCIEGAVNGDLFSGWVEQQLAPTLRPGDVVVMDSLSSHKMRRVVQAIERVGAEVRYLPPYSPDLNPIEMAFSMLKTPPRRSPTNQRGPLATLRASPRPLQRRRMPKLYQACGVSIQLTVGRSKTSCSHLAQAAFDQSCPFTSSPTRTPSTRRQPPNESSRWLGRNNAQLRRRGCSRDAEDSYLWVIGYPPATGVASLSAITIKSKRDRGDNGVEGGSQSQLVAARTAIVWQSDRSVYHVIAKIIQA